MKPKLSWLIAVLVLGIAGLVIKKSSDGVKNSLSGAPSSPDKTATVQDFARHLEANPQFIKNLRGGTPGAEKITLNLPSATLEALQDSEFKDRIQQVTADNAGELVQDIGNSLGKEDLNSSNFLQKSKLLDIEAYLIKTYGIKDSDEIFAIQAVQTLGASDPVYVSYGQKAMQLCLDLQPDPAARDAKRADIIARAGVTLPAPPTGPAPGPDSSDSSEDSSGSGNSPGSGSASTSDN